MVKCAEGTRGIKEIKRLSLLHKQTTIAGPIPEEAVTIIITHSLSIARWSTKCEINEVSPNINQDDEAEGVLA